MTAAPVAIRLRLHERPALRTSQQGPITPKSGEKTHCRFNPQRCVCSTRCPERHPLTSISAGPWSRPPSHPTCPLPRSRSCSSHSPESEHQWHLSLSPPGFPCTFQPPQPPCHTLCRVLFCPNALAPFKTPLPKFLRGCFICKPHNPAIPSPVCAEQKGPYYIPQMMGSSIHSSVILNSQNDPNVRRAENR